MLPRPRGPMHPTGCRTGGNDGRAGPVVTPGLWREEAAARLKAERSSEAQLRPPAAARSVCAR